LLDLLCEFFNKLRHNSYSNAEDSAGWLSTLNYIVHVRFNLLV